MPLAVTCRHCGASYEVADELRGRALLCKECDQPVTVGGAAKPSPLRWVVRAVVLALALLPLGALGLLWWTGWLWDFVEWPQFDVAGGRPPANAVTIHVAHADRLDDFQDDLNELMDGGRPQFTGWAAHGDRATLVLAPVANPDEFYRKIDFGTAYRTDDRLFTLVLPTRGRAEPIAKALSDLKSDKPARRRGAARRLREVKPDERREKVARALEARLDDADAPARAEAAAALGVWGTPESVTPLLRVMRDPENNGIAAEALGQLAADGQVPAGRRGEVARALEGFLDNPGNFGHTSAILALGRLKDPGSAEPLARRLEDFFDGDHAAEALRQLGPAAEKAVAKRLTHKDFSVREKACAVLGDIGTPASVPALRAVQGDFFTDRHARAAIQKITSRHGAEPDK